MKLNETVSQFLIPFYWFFFSREQELQNLLQQKKYTKAIGLAIRLEQPFRALNMFKGKRFFLSVKCFYKNGIGFGCSKLKIMLSLLYWFEYVYRLIAVKLLGNHLSIGHIEVTIAVIHVRNSYFNMTYW